MVRQKTRRAIRGRGKKSTWEKGKAQRKKKISSYRANLLSVQKTIPGSGARFSKKGDTQG